jgi:Zn-dependent peptidase ImmA (M78 family)
MMADIAEVFAQGFLATFGLDCGGNLPEIAAKIGLTVVEVEAENFDGALLRVQGTNLGRLILNSRIREAGRKRFTLAHEIGHYVLPTHTDLRTPCQRSDIENWSTRTSSTEIEANRFAAEILLPKESLSDFVKVAPSFDTIQKIATRFGTSLTAASYRLAELSSYRVAVVWSSDGRAVWYRRSEEFGRAVKTGVLDEGTFAFDCFRGNQVPNQFEPVAASAWLYDDNLKDDAKIWEHSLYLPSYNSTLTLLCLKEPVEIRTDFDEYTDDSLNPEDFTLGRRRWPK